MTEWRLLESSPLDGDLMSGLATTVDRRDTPNETVHDGGSLGDSPSPLQDPALSVRAITGRHTVPVSIQRRGQMAPSNDGSWGLPSRL
jgi:hypothetical protein